MTTAATQSRRIALRAAGKQYDLVVPRSDALAHILAVAGVHLAQGEYVMGPDGTPIDPATAASELREGGLYSVTRVAAATARSERDRGSAAAGSTLPWALVAAALALLPLALASGSEGMRWLAAAVVALSAVVTTLRWARRSTSQTNFLSLATPLVLGALAGMLCVPPGIDHYPLYVCAIAAAASATLLSLVSVASPVPRVRAGAASAAVIMVFVAALALASPLLRWDAAQLAIVLAAVSVLAIRALPSLLVNVDEGYFIDYGKFMVLRWSVRGRVPEYMESVEEARVMQLVANAEARLRASTLLLSGFAAAGIAAAMLPFVHGNLLEKIAASAFVLFAVLGLMLTSRRTVSPGLRNPPRIAVAVGLIGGAVVLGGIVSGQSPVLAAAVMLAAAALAAILSVSVAGGIRSLGWSRTGDIVDSIAVALVLPAGLLAAGTLDLLRGVFAG